MSRSRVDDTTIETRLPAELLAARSGKGAGAWGLVVIYERAQPDRIGEVGFLDGTLLLGRGDKREDIPLLIRHLLAKMSGEHPQLARFFDDGKARIDAELVDALVRHDYELHARELATILWQAISESEGTTIGLTDSVRAALAKDDMPTSEVSSTREASKEQVEAALTRNAGNVTRAARELGLKNRFALYRLMKTLGIASKD